MTDIPSALVTGFMHMTKHIESSHDEQIRASNVLGYLSRSLESSRWSSNTADFALKRIGDQLIERTRLEQDFESIESRLIDTRTRVQNILWSDRMIQSNDADLIAEARLIHGMSVQSKPPSDGQVWASNLTTLHINKLERMRLPQIDLDHCKDVDIESARNSALSTSNLVNTMNNEYIETSNSIPVSDPYSCPMFDSVSSLTISMFSNMAWVLNTQSNSSTQSKVFWTSNMGIESFKLALLSCNALTKTLADCAIQSNVARSMSDDITIMREITSITSRLSKQASNLITWASSQKYNGHFDQVSYASNTATRAFSESTAASNDLSKLSALSLNASNLSREALDQAVFVSESICLLCDDTYRKLRCVSNSAIRASTSSEQSIEGFEHVSNVTRSVVDNRAFINKISECYNPIVSRSNHVLNAYSNCKHAADYLSYSSNVLFHSGPVIFWTSNALATSIYMSNNDADVASTKALKYARSLLQISELAIDFANQIQNIN